MDAFIKIEKEFEIKYLRVDAHVRYWEDADINGEDDIDLDENPDSKPRMPFAIFDNSEGEWRWVIKIDVDNGSIVDWPKGTVAHVHYKVCDEGIYTLLDKSGENIACVESYVPECLSPKEDGFGDYIILEIDEDGHIDGFDFTQDDVDEIISKAF